MARKEIPQLPYEALREALINAVVHRDYFEKGGNVMVEIYENRIEITNPGGLVKGLTPENFGKVSMLRNPGIANLFQRIDYIEKMGTGIERIRLALLEANAPAVQYELNPAFIKAVFPRSAEFPGTTQETTQENFKSGEKIKLGKTEKMILQLIENQSDITINILAKKLHLGSTAIENNLSKLKQKGLIRRVGPDKGGFWEILKDWQ